MATWASPGVGKAAQTPPQTYWAGVCILTSAPGTSAHDVEISEAAADPDLPGPLESPIPSVHLESFILEFPVGLGKLL